MPDEQSAITTRDGACPTLVVTPDGGGPWPAVILYMDAGGIRPGLAAIARRLASSGYVVLVPDLFYRHGPYGPLVPRELFAGDFMAVVGPLMATTSNARAADDTAALLAHLAARADVTGRIGAVGFCMGGGMAIVAAGAHPDRFAAVASFHGGNLATDAADSPHLSAPNLRAELLVAAATDDPFYPPAMARRFETALTAAAVSFHADTYPAAHGWMVPDVPVHDPAQAERGWTAMLALFARALR